MGYICKAHNFHHMRNTIPCTPAKALTMSRSGQSRMKHVERGNQNMPSNISNLTRNAKELALRARAGIR